MSGTYVFVWFNDYTKPKKRELSYEKCEERIFRLRKTNKVKNLKTEVSHR